jgi:hypothetical protein
MSNFLLVSVNDLNYFAESQLGKEILPEERIRARGNYFIFFRSYENLIKKANRSKLVKFRIIRLPEIYSIFLDECKFKKVVINLLSNAVKIHNFLGS